MVRMRVIVLALLALVVLVAGPASAKLSASVGETWIRWDYETAVPLNSTTEVYLNGRLEGTADDVLYGIQKSRWNPFLEDWDVYYVYSFYLSALNPGEEHHLELRTVSEDPGLRGEELASLRAKTLPPQSLVLFLLAIMVGISLLVMVLQDEIRVVLVGLLGAAFGVFLFPLMIGYGLLWTINLGLILFQGIFVGLALYRLFEEHLAWW